MVNVDYKCCELEKRLKKDPEAFVELYELNYKRIYNYILYSTGNVEDALDLTKVDPISLDTE
jgi:DNA-directed RNA polymerase specialized sigma24 family protein